jgi:hypothetical protein
MTIDPNILLKQLEPAVRPTYAQTPAARPTAPLEHQEFDELLAKASQGLVESGRSVSASYETPEELTPNQINRLSTAADLAEASGARRALLLMDGRGLVLDVATRTLNTELSSDPSAHVVELDTAVYVAGADEQRSGAASLPTGVAPRAVGEQLDSVQRPPSAAA